MKTTFLTITILIASLTNITFATAVDPIRLWPGTPPGDENVKLGEESDTSGPDSRQVAGKHVIRLGNVSTPILEVYRADSAKASGASVIICPGGGHSILAYDLEGTEVAEWLQSIGVTAFVLKYRVPARPDRPRYEAAVQDGQRAVSIVRSRAAQWSLDPNKIGVLGFSAGGQTAALTALTQDRLYDSKDATDQVSHRPNFAVLVYPAYLVGKENPTQLQPEVTVDKNSPPMFLVHAWDDPVTPQSSLQLASALKSAGITAELHLFDRGGHGYGMRPTELPVTHWPKLCEDWLEANNLIKHQDKTKESDISQIQKLLDDQITAWNRGDIDGFMAGYWESEDLTFSSGGDVTRGFKATSERYHKRYDSKEKMGKTTFSNIEVNVLTDDAAKVLGNWKLERKDETLGGNFTLLLQRFPEGWKIIHDHTTASPKPLS